jgi:hypothetical protein
MNSDVSLSAYELLSTGATFTHPISGHHTTDKATQFADNKTQFLNLQATIPSLSDVHVSENERFASLLSAGQKNFHSWADLLWISGGNLNLGKCFTYSILPDYNFSSQKMKVRPIPFQSTIRITNPADASVHEADQIAPTCARRTLGVIMAPDGSNKLQLRHTLLKAKTFLGQLSNSSLSQHALWVAVQMVVIPGIIYPLMATYYTPQDIQKIESVISQLICKALGLNRNFPRTALHGPLLLGGMGIPTVAQRITAICLNYFLFNICQASPLS